MRSELIPWMHIGSYPVLIILGFVFGWGWARWRAPQAGIRRFHVDNLVLIAAVAGFFGARLFSRIFYMQDVAIWESWRFWEGGGQVFFGGALAAIFAIVTYGLWRGVRLGSLFDVLAPSAALGLAFGRVGCFLAGCCWGDVCVDPAVMAGKADAAYREQVQTFEPVSGAGVAWSVQFPPRTPVYKRHMKDGWIEAGEAGSLPVHPVQLYEAVLALGLALFLNWRFRRRQRPGELAVLLGAGYGLIRFWMEYFRADNPMSYGGMTLSQVISLGIVGVAVLGWIFWRRVPDGKQGMGALKLAPAGACETVAAVYEHCHEDGRRGQHRLDVQSADFKVPPASGSLRSGG